MLPMGWGFDVIKKDLNCKGLNCPLPIVEISKAFKELAVGEKIRVTADCDAFIGDVRAWAETRNQRIIAEEEGELSIVVIEKTGE